MGTQEKVVSDVYFVVSILAALHVPKLSYFLSGIAVIFANLLLELSDV